MVKSSCTQGSVVYTICVGEINPERRQQSDRPRVLRVLRLVRDNRLW